MEEKLAEANAALQEATRQKERFDRKRAAEEKEKQLLMQAPRGIQIFFDYQADNAATIPSRLKADFPIDRVALFYGCIHFYLGTFGLFGQHHIQTFLCAFIAHTG